MHLKLSAIAFVSILSVAACGDDDPFEDGGSASPDGSTDGSVKDGSTATEDSGTDTDSGTEDAG
ncbi:MAG TPA: hypothetical protein VFG30_18195 [Polyangiales bacterium]|nr:hypothetical protein [Polyangiales bacterium]